jgi:hypothetical protein
MDGFASRQFPHLIGASVAIGSGHQPDYLQNEPEPRPSVGGVILELATSRYRLAKAVRTYVRDALEIGTDPAEIRATALARLAVLDPADPESVADITAFMKATLDEALGRDEGV